MQKTGPGAQPLPTNKKPHASYMTPPTLAGKKGVKSMGVPEPKEKDLSTREKVSETSEKISAKTINTSNMSKSLFEKLFEDVMSETDVDLGAMGSDEAALGIDAEAGESEMGGDEVTLKLDRATAEKLHAALGALLGGMGGEEEEFEGGEEMGEEMGEEGEEPLPESVSVEPEPKELKANVQQFHGKPDAIHGSTIKASKGKAETGKVAVEAEPKALGAKPETLQKHANKVASKVTSGTGKSLFDV